MGILDSTSNYVNGNGEHMSFSAVILMAGGAATINVIGTISQGRDPFPVAMAGGVFVTTLAFIDEASSELADALAGLYLLSTILFRGVWFFTWLAQVTGSTPQQPGNIKTPYKGEQDI